MQKENNHSSVTKNLIDLSLTETMSDTPSSVYESLLVLESASSSSTTLQTDLIEKSLVTDDDNNSDINQSSTSPPETSEFSSSPLSLDTLNDSDHGLNNINDTDVDKRGNPSACIFVASLNKEKTDEQLNITVYKHFEQWGKLVNVKVFKDWKSRPYAFVQYERICDAKVALEKAHGTILDNRAIRCESAKVNRTLCLRPLHQALNKDDVYNEISIFGPIEDITIGNNNTLPVAFVRFHYRDDAIRAYLTLQTTIYKSQWYAEWIANLNTNHQPQVRHDRTCIYIGNIDKIIKKEDIRHRFEKYGEILNINIVQRNEPYRKVTFGFVKYSDEKEAQAAIDSENGQTWYGNILVVACREIRPYRNNRFNNNNNNDNDNSGNTSANIDASSPPTTIVWTTRDGLHSYQQNRPHPPGLSIPAANFYPYHTPITVYPSTTISPSPPPPSAITTTTTTSNSKSKKNKQVTFADTNNNTSDNNKYPSTKKDSPTITYPTSVNTTTTYYTPTSHAPHPYYKTTTPLNYNTYYVSNGNNNNLYHYGYIDNTMNINHNVLPENPPSSVIAYPSVYYYCYYPNQNYSATPPLYNSYYQMYPPADTQQYMLTSPITDISNSSISKESSSLKYKHSNNNNIDPTFHEIDQDRNPNCTADTTDDDD